MAEDNLTEALFKRYIRKKGTFLNVPGLLYPFLRGQFYSTALPGSSKLKKPKIKPYRKMTRKLKEETLDENKREISKAATLSLHYHHKANATDNPRGRTIPATREYMKKTYEAFADKYGNEFKKRLNSYIENHPEDTESPEYKVLQHSMKSDDDIEELASLYKYLKKEKNESMQETIEQLESEILDLLGDDELNESIFDPDEDLNESWKGSLKRAGALIGGHPFWKDQKSDDEEAANVADSKRKDATAKDLFNKTTAGQEYNDHVAKNKAAIAKHLPRYDALRSKLNALHQTHKDAAKQAKLIPGQKGIDAERYHTRRAERALELQGKLNSGRGRTGQAYPPAATLRFMSRTGKPTGMQNREAFWQGQNDRFQTYSKIRKQLESTNMQEVIALRLKFNNLNEDEDYTSIIEEMNNLGFEADEAEYLLNLDEDSFEDILRELPKLYEAMQEQESAHLELIEATLDNRPADVETIFEQLLKDRLSLMIEEYKRDIAKNFFTERRNESEEDLDETSYRKDIDHSKPIIVHGVKGVKNRPFKKQFKSMKHFDDWADSDENLGNIEIHHIDQDEKHTLKKEDTDLDEGIGNWVRKNMPGRKGRVAKKIDAHMATMDDRLKKASSSADQKFANWKTLADRGTFLHGKMLGSGKTTDFNNYNDHKVAQDAAFAASDNDRTKARSAASRGLELIRAKHKIQGANYDRIKDHKIPKFGRKSHGAIKNEETEE